MQEWDLKISLEERFRGKYLFFNDFKVLNNINSKLSSIQKELFGGTSFGPFFKSVEIQVPRSAISPSFHEQVETVKSRGDVVFDW